MPALLTMHFSRAASRCCKSLYIPASRCRPGTPRAPWPSRKTDRASVHRDTLGIEAADFFGSTLSELCNQIMARLAFLSAALAAVAAAEPKVTNKVRDPVSRQP